MSVKKFSKRGCGSTFFSSGQMRHLKMECSNRADCDEQGNLPYEVVLRGPKDKNKKMQKDSHETL
jgi:hypothetical protein